MSSSGKGQSLLKGPDDVAPAWQYASQGGRVNQGKVIVEGLIAFDYEITLLTVRAIGDSGQVETFFCEPIGQRPGQGRLRRELAAARHVATRARTLAGDRTRSHR